MLKPFPQNLDTAKVFQAASQTCYRLSYPWVLATAAGVLGIGLTLLIRHNTAGLSELTTAKIVFACFCVIVASMIRIVLLQSKYLRCPACGRMPTTDHGMPIDPQACPKCGARLK